jgi:hypothetical protein
MYAYLHTYIIAWLHSPIQVCIFIAWLHCPIHVCIFAYIHYSLIAPSSILLMISSFEMASCLYPFKLLGGACCHCALLCGWDRSDPVCMYVCMYVCICTNMGVCSDGLALYVCMYMYRHVCVCRGGLALVCVYMCLCACMYVYGHGCVAVIYERLYVCMYVCV